jgi:hypothetical protein
LVGGVANAVGNAGVQIANNRSDGMTWAESIQQINKAEVAIAAGTGFVSGAIAPVTGLWGGIAANAALGGMQYVATEMIANDGSFSELDPARVGESVAMGGVAGAIMPRLPDEVATQLGKTNFFGQTFSFDGRLGTAIDPYTQAIAPEFHRNNTSGIGTLGGEQLKELLRFEGLGQTALGAVIGNQSGITENVRNHVSGFGNPNRLEDSFFQ